MTPTVIFEKSIKLFSSMTSVVTNEENSKLWFTAEPAGVTVTERKTGKTVFVPMARVSTIEPSLLGLGSELFGEEPPKRRGRPPKAQEAATETA